MKYVCELDPSEYLEILGVISFRRLYLEHQSPEISEDEINRLNELYETLRKAELKL